MDKKIGAIIAPISPFYFAPPASVPNEFACCTIAFVNAPNMRFQTKRQNPQCS